MTDDIALIEFQRERVGVLRLVGITGILLGLLIAGACLLYMASLTPVTPATSRPYSYGAGPNVVYVFSYANSSTPGPDAVTVMTIGCSIATVLIAASISLLFGSGFGRWLIGFVGIGLVGGQVYFFCLENMPTVLQVRSWRALLEQQDLANALLLSLTFPILCIVTAFATRQPAGRHRL